MRTLTSLIPAAALLALAACSDDSGNNGVSADMQPIGDMDTSCGVGIYPCGPYGTSANSVVANMELQGYMDAKELCKEHKDKVQDTATLRKISFKDYHLGDSSCAAMKKTLLWVMVSAGWCVPCQAEVKAVQAKYEAGSYDKRLGIINDVFETTKSNVPADAAFIKQWADGFKLTYPVLMDPQFKVGAYFSKTAAPFNMLIDTKTMKIVYRSTGSDLNNLEKKVQKFFK